MGRQLKLILDVDTGVDDALAIALAIRHPAAELEAVVSVAGNVGLELTTRNSLRVLDWLGAASIPVYAGADRPLSGVLREASHWHGLDGLGGAGLPESARSAEPGGVDYICQRVMDEPGEVTLVCTGPLTNVALAVEREPRIVGKVRDIVVMGGVTRPPGNVTPVAEFNIYADPLAAARVFEQDWPISMVGLDVTERVTLTRAERNRFAQHTSAEAVLLYEVTRHIFDVNAFDAMSLHDPLALLVALQRDLVTSVRADVAVETRGEHTLGQTVVDLRRGAATPKRRTRVCTQVDVQRARELFFNTLGL